VLDRDDSPGGEALPIAESIDFVEDRHARITGTQEVCVQRMDHPVRLIDRSRRRDECLPRNLPAEHSLTIFIRGLSTEDVHLDRL
jgi:hypothetical protein